MKVCLVAEGSYPYVSGGVAEWTHELVSSMPDIEFSLLALLPYPDALGPPKYESPKNLKQIQPLYLSTGELKADKPGPGTYDRLASFHRSLQEGKTEEFPAVVADLCPMRFAESREAWRLLVDLYRESAPEGTPFPDYFWTWKSTHLPMFRALQGRVPECDVIHCLSTGFAGLLGAAERSRSGRPLLTTEHGLYAAERTREIREASWIPGESLWEFGSAPNYFQDLWKNLFRSLARIAYRSSDRIVTLFEGNRRAQIEEGAPSERTAVIPNGVDDGEYAPIRARRAPSDRLRVGMIGRVVPIKDVKGFLYACKIANDRCPLQAWILGPMEEDESYASQCRELQESLGLSEVVSFEGKVDVRAYYDHLDVVTLTSLREAQPRALLEAHACALPAVATDVGACREILEGGTPEDRALGPSGIVTAVADPQGTAQALIDMGRDAERRERMGEAGLRRVVRFYRKAETFAAYRRLYQELAHGRN